MIYAIGDVHGRFDLLVDLHAKITQHAETIDEKHFVVFLGDYIDRGPDSKKVVDFLMSEPFSGFEHFFLRGNHEDMFIQTCITRTGMVNFDSYEHRDHIGFDVFIGNGGAATLRDFGVAQAYENAYEVCHQTLDYSKLAPYKDWFMDLLNYVEINDYVFVHAGIMPKISIENQDPQILYWIRSYFLNWTEPHYKMVVHGHTPKNTALPEVKSNRINVDTHAYSSGILTAAVLDFDSTVKPLFISTENRTEQPWELME